jgi:hypothetical protein
MGVELDLSHKGRSIDRGCLRTGELMRTFSFRGRKWRKAGEDCKMRSVVTCMLHQILLVRPRRIIWVEHVARIGEMRNAYNILVGKPEGKRLLGRPRRRWDGNIRMCLRETGWEVVD